MFEQGLHFYDVLDPIVMSQSLPQDLQSGLLWEADPLVKVYVLEPSVSHVGYYLGTVPHSSHGHVGLYLGSRARVT